MKIQSIQHFPFETQVSDVLARLNQDDPSKTVTILSKWPDLQVEFSAVRALSRDRDEYAAFLIRAEVPEEFFESALEGFSAEDSRFIFVGSLLEHGWETVPQKREIAYLYGHIADGELESALKYDDSIRTYDMRSKLLPNINRRFTRFVVLAPDLPRYIEEANSNFPRQCYVLHDVISRVSGSLVDTAELARLNGFSLNGLADYIGLLEALAGQMVTLPQGQFKLEPIGWPLGN